MEFNETKKKTDLNWQRKREETRRRRKWDSVMDGTKTRKNKLGRVDVDFSFLGLPFLQEKALLTSR